MKTTAPPLFDMQIKRLLVFFVLAAGCNVRLRMPGLAASRTFAGYPLDDAWIHQTYARNWAETGQLAYVVGLPSAGSTAPLWTLLLSVAYRVADRSVPLDAGAGHCVSWRSARGCSRAWPIGYCPAGRR